MRAPIRILAATALFLCAGASSAATISKLNESSLAPLREANVRRSIVIAVALDDRTSSRIELEQFEVWAPGAKVVIHGANGVQMIDPPVRRFYRGLVNGDRESFAFFSLDPATESIEGMIVTRDGKFVIGGRRMRNSRPGPARFDDVLTAAGPEDEIPEDARTWQCDVDKLKPVESNPTLHATGIDGLPVETNGITGTQRYAMTVEIETDFELYQNAGGTPAAQTNLTNYITALTGAVSTIYNRDLKTNVTQSNLHFYTVSAAADPWAAADPSAGLDELADFYHGVLRPSGRTTSSVVMLSGKDIPAGVAYEHIICTPDGFNAGRSHFFGPYAWCGAIGKAFGTTEIDPVPTSNVNTPPYNMPPENPSTFSIQTFWPLEEYAHEMGHNLGGHHTHCVAMLPAEQTALGRVFVDDCFKNEGIAGCVSSVPAGKSCDGNGFCQPVVPEKGSIMSYCHNLFVLTAPSTFTPQSRYTFGQATDPSHNELDNYMLRAAGPLAGGNNIVNGVGSFTINTFTVPPSVGPSSTGNLASITATGGVTFAWTITNGTITGGQGTSAITFTAGASGTVTLGVSAYGANLCGVSDTKTVAIVAGFSPPTNVVATYNGAISVNLTWTAPATGTPPVQYDVYRSLDNDYTSFILATTSMTTAGTDSTVSGNFAYMYKVRSAGAGGTNESGDSNRDIATIVVYTNPSLTVNMTPLTAVDMNDLRTAANAVHRLAKLGAVTFTNPTITAGSSTIQAADMNDIRQAINTSFSTMGLTPITFTDTPLTVGMTLIKALHSTQARNAMQ